METNNDIKENICKYFNFYEQKVIPAIKSNSRVTQKDYGFHGLYTHTDSVVFRGIYYALCLDKDPIPVIFACAFHDLARTDDGYNETHGERAVPIAKEIMEDFSDILTDGQKESVLYAVENHTIGLKAPDYVQARDYVSSCLWDADRTRLGWIYGYEASLMSTDEAKRAASGRAENFLKFQNECLGRDLNEDREEIFLRIAKINS